MNKIIACFDENASNAYRGLRNAVTETNVGVFAGRRAAFNNNPLLILDNEFAPFAEKVNIAALLRRIFIGIVVNDAPKSDVPTHVLVVANGTQEDAIQIVEDEYSDVLNEFANLDVQVPSVVFVSASDTELEQKVADLIGEDVVEVVETPVAETEVVEAPVAEVTETEVVETPVAETEVAETPVVETPKSNKRKK